MKMIIFCYVLSSGLSHIHQSFQKKKRKLPPTPFLLKNKQQVPQKVVGTYQTTRRHIQEGRNPCCCPERTNNFTLKFNGFLNRQQIKIITFSAAQKAKPGLGRFIVDVSSSLTIIRAQ